MKVKRILLVLLVSALSGCSGKDDSDASRANSVPSEEYNGGLSAQVAESSDEVTANPMVLVESEFQKWDFLKQSRYYRANLLSRYIDYLEKNPDLDTQKAVVHVNADLDKPFYTDIKIVSQPENILVLCNKYNSLPEDYEPKDLVNVGGGYLLRAEAATAYREMMQAASQKNLAFQLRSAYRSYAYQQRVYNRYVTNDGRSKADTYSARPGHSEHQTGLSFDITQPVSGGTLSSAHFDKTPQFAWLGKHAHEYGFILRYPASKTHITGFIYEPWHYRYAGKDVATQIYEQGLTFDEYVAMYRPRG
ncbi:MAG: M15 family metallopeptidase [Burkholderiales bacterium]|jgi:D-alanyl-D-alanine carboxypeptidase|nr:M15 family metallopeptidase [Burkholderiales bacterium]